MTLDHFLASSLPWLWDLLADIGTTPGGWLLPLAAVVGILLLIWIAIDTVGSYSVRTVATVVHIADRRRCAVTVGRENR